MVEALLSLFCGVLSLLFAIAFLIKVMIDGDNDLFIPLALGATVPILMGNWLLRITEKKDKAN